MNTQPKNAMRTQGETMRKKQKSTLAKTHKHLNI